MPVKPIDVKQEEVSGLIFMGIVLAICGVMILGLTVHQQGYFIVEYSGICMQLLTLVILYIGNVSLTYYD